jgi:hypothetical protein
VREYRRDVEATGAFHVHEKAIGGLNEALELVLTLLVGGRGVEEVLGHFRSCLLRG